MTLLSDFTKMSFHECDPTHVNYNYNYNPHGGTMLVSLVSFLPRPNTKCTVHTSSLRIRLARTGISPTTPPLTAVHTHTQQDDLTITKIWSDGGPHFKSSGVVRGTQRKKKRVGAELSTFVCKTNLVRTYDAYVRKKTRYILPGPFWGSEGSRSAQEKDTTVIYIFPLPSKLRDSVLPGLC